MHVALLGHVLKKRFPLDSLGSLLEQTAPSRENAPGAEDGS